MIIWKEILKVNRLPVDIVVVAPSAHMIIDNVTSFGALLSVVSFTSITISVTFPAGKLFVGNDVGTP